MSVLPIATVGDPVLRERAAELTAEELTTADVQRLIDDLIETKRAGGGAGLAANQVSVTKRIAIVEVDEHTRYRYKPRVPLTVIVNPGIEVLSDERLLINEGCLSVPDLRGDVERAVAVRVRYLDRDGNPHGVDATVSPPARFSTRSIILTVCCSSTASPTRGASARGSSSSAIMRPRSCGGSRRMRRAGRAPGDALLVRARLARRGRSSSAAS